MVISFRNYLTSRVPVWGSATVKICQSQQNNGWGNIPIYGGYISVNGGYIPEDSGYDASNSAELSNFLMHLQILIWSLFYIVETKSGFSKIVKHFYWAASKKRAGKPSYIKHDLISRAQKSQVIS